MDDIVDRFSKRVLKNPDNMKYVTKDVIKKTYGFDYKQNFRMMIVKTAGIHSCERLEASIDQTVLVPFAVELGNLKTVRDRLPRQVFAVKAVAGKAQAPQHLPHNHLGFSVLGPDGAHVCASSARRDPVHGKRPPRSTGSHRQPRGWRATVPS
jgi:hypothetical protein